MTENQIINLLSQTMSFLESIPGWGWVIIVIVMIIIFGDRKVWEFEVNFSLVEGVGHGEIEFESVSSKFSKKEKKSIEIELKLEPAAQGKTYQVFLKGFPVHTISAAESNSSFVRIREKYEGNKPNQGDLVEVRCDKEVVFSGKLHKD